MNTLVAQHPWLCLAAVFLLGITFKYLLDVFFLRQRLFDAEAAVQRRGQELDSERYAHGRTSAELKAKLAELDATQKARTLSESLLAGSRAKQAETQAFLASARAEVAELKRQGAAREADLNAALAATECRLSGAEAEAREHAATVTDLGLRLAVQEAELATAVAANTELRANFAQVFAEADAATQRIPRLEHELDSQTTKANALMSDLQAALRAQSDAQASAGEAQSALAASQSALVTTRKAKTELETALAKARGEITVLQTRLEKLETALGDAKADTGPLEQKLKSRQEDVKQLTAQLGEATEELVALRTKHAQTEANLAAAAQTRTALETEAKVREERIAALLNELAVSTQVRTALETDAQARAGQGTASQEKLEALTAELQTVAERHAALKANLDDAVQARTKLETEARAREKQSAALQEKLDEVNAELKTASEAYSALQAELADRPVVAAVVAPSAAVNNDSLLAELDAMSRERNELAAELAILRAAAPAPAKRTKRPAPVAELALELKEFTAAGPQSLAEVAGVGPAFESRLYAAGVGSYWELAQLSDGDLASALELSDTERGAVDFDEIRHDAARLARETKSVGRKWSGAEPDRLLVITGLSASFEKKLYDADLCTLAALAQATPEQLAEICPGNPQQPPDHADWIAQAKARLAESEG